MKKTLLLSAMAFMLALTSMAQTAGKVVKKVEVKEVKAVQKAKAEVIEAKPVQKAKAEVVASKPSKRVKKAK
jgi:hypothetical protein